MYSAGVFLLLYVVLPFWILAGFTDYLCHRKAHIQDNAGPKESVLHLLGMAVVALPLIAGLLLEINALLIAIMFVALLLHEWLIIWDVRYAAARRPITPTEQHIHGALEFLPFTALLLVLATHWPQFLAIFAEYSEPSQFSLRVKMPALSVTYLGSIFTLVLLLVVLPFVEELFRCLRARHRRADIGLRTR